MEELVGDERTRWPFLDLVRFVAALLVMFGHFRGYFFESITKVHAGPATQAFYVLSGVHHEAVIMFFVVSGFLIGGRAWVLCERRQFDLRLYFIDRLSRIYVVFIPAMLLVSMLEPLGEFLFSGTRLFGARPLFPSGITAGWTWAQVPCHIAQLQSLTCSVWGLNPPLWSLAFEWNFYFAAPLLLSAIYAPMHPIARISAVAILAFGFAQLFPGVSTLLPLFAVWSAGALSARAAIRRPAPLSLGIFALATVIIALVLSRASILPLPVTDGAIALGLAVAFACPTITRLRIADSIVRRGAAFSFSLYLTHVPVGLFIGAALERVGWPRDLAPPGLATYSAFVITAVSCVGVAILFGRATEDNTERVREWLKQPLGPDVARQQDAGCTTYRSAS